LQASLQSEVLLCPNCKEEVPKTLYCLNCGYPLYKIELDRNEDEKVSEAVEQEAPDITEEKETQEDKTPVSEDVTIDVDKVDEDEIEDKEAEVEAEDIEIEDESTEEVTSEVVQDFPSEDTPASEETTEAEQELEEPVDIHEIEPVEIEMEEAEEQEQTIIVESGEKTEIEAESVIEPITEIIQEEVDEPSSQYEPDPTIKEVMDNFVKNITMKIRLVNLLKNDEVKAEIFSKLFNNYVARGKVLSKSRTEIIERVKYDLNSMEKALHDAKEGLEELEIRKTINDISEEEYAAKAPGYEWDIKQYKDEVGKKKAEIAYLEDMDKVLTQDEIDELVTLGEECKNSIDSLVESEKITKEMADRVKPILENTLAFLNTC
jgi:hypothetical protein